MVTKQASVLGLCLCEDAVNGLMAATRECKQDMAVWSQQAMLASRGMTGVSAQAEMMQAEMMWTSSKHPHCNTDLYGLSYHVQGPGSGARPATPCSSARQQAGMGHGCHDS